MEVCLGKSGEMARAWRKSGLMECETVFIFLCLFGSTVCLLPLLPDWWAAADGTGATMPFVCACAISYLYVFMGLVTYCAFSRMLTGKRLTLGNRQVAVTTATMLIPPLLCVALAATEMRQRGADWSKYAPNWTEFLSAFAMISIHMVFSVGTMVLFFSLIAGLVNMVVLSCLLVPRMRRFKGAKDTVAILLRCSLLVLLMIFVFRFTMWHCCCPTDRVAVLMAKIRCEAVNLPTLVSMGVCIAVAQRIWRPYRISATSVLSVVAAIAAVCLVVSTTILLVGWRPDTRKLELPSNIHSKAFQRCPPGM